MTPTEAAELLGRIAHVDRFAPQPSTDMAEGWAALLDDITLAEALAVCRDHYRRTTDTIAPADVVAGVRARRRDALDRAAVPSQAPDPELLRRLEAFADSKAVDHALTALPPVQRDRRGRGDRGADTVAAAMRAGDRKRRAALDAGTGSASGEPAGEPAAEPGTDGEGARDAES